MKCRNGVRRGGNGWEWWFGNGPFSINFHSFHSIVSPKVRSGVLSSMLSNWTSTQTSSEHEFSSPKMYFCTSSATAQLQDCGSPQWGQMLQSEQESSADIHWWLVWAASQLYRPLMLWWFAAGIAQNILESKNSTLNGLVSATSGRIESLQARRTQIRTHAAIGCSAYWRTHCYECVKVEPTKKAPQTPS